MLRRHQVEHPAASLEERIAERIDEIRAKAEALPLGSRRTCTHGAQGKAGRYSQPYHRVADIPGIEAARLKGERCV